MRVALWADNVVDPDHDRDRLLSAQFLQALDRLDDQHSYTAFYTSRTLSQEFPLRLQRIRTKMSTGYAAPVLSNVAHIELATY